MAGILGHAEKMVTEFHNFVSDPVNNPFLLSVAVVLLSSCKFFGLKCSDFS